ncbi:MAG: hypothetical protein ACLFWG_04145, partial [Longimicrobiales bacterium]
MRNSCHPGNLFSSCLPGPPGLPGRLLGRLLLPAVLMVPLVTCGDSSTGPDEEPFMYSHTRNPGTSAEDFLRDDDFTRLTIEIDYVGELHPDQRALDSLEVFLERRLHKPDGIDIFLDESIPSGSSPYSADDIRAMEQEHRDTYSEEGELAAYYIFLDGEYEEQNVLGVA